jgi:hypothetical protein
LARRLEGWAVVATLSSFEARQSSHLRMTGGFEPIPFPPRPREPMAAREGDFMRTWFGAEAVLLSGVRRRCRALYTQHGQENGHGDREQSLFEGDGLRGEL